MVWHGVARHGMVWYFPEHLDRSSPFLPSPGKRLDYGDLMIPLTQGTVTMMMMMMLMMNTTTGSNGNTVARPDSKVK